MEVDYTNIKCRECENKYSVINYTETRVEDNKTRGCVESLVCRTCRTRILGRSDEFYAIIDEYLDY